MNVESFTAPVSVTVAEQPVPDFFKEIGIGDQTLFRVNVENAVAESAGKFAVIIIDGEGITKANRDGRQWGDRKIKAIASGIQTNIRTKDEPGIVESRIDEDEAQLPEKDTAYHISGDEFAVILRGIETPKDLDSWVLRFGQAMDMQDIAIYMGPVQHNIGESAAEVIERSDQLMQEVKKTIKMGNLNGEQREFLRSLGAQIVAKGIDLEDLPTLIDTLLTDPNYLE